MNINWTHMEEGLDALTANPATAILFKLIGLASTVTGVSSQIDVWQNLANHLIDSVQAGVVPMIRPEEPRHEAAIALAVSGTPVPAAVAEAAPGTVPTEVTAS